MVRLAIIRIIKNHDHDEGGDVDKGDDDQMKLIRVMMTKFLHGDVSQGVRRWWVAVLLPRNIIIVITDQQSS